MELLASGVKQALTRSSWIRRMFEAGIEMKKKYGDEAVCDFSLGNPDLAPPPQVRAALEEFAAGADKPFAIGYMPNAGYPEVRTALAASLAKEQGIDVAGTDLILTVGAAGALNVVMRAVLEPGDEVICPAPVFVDYGAYAWNFGGTLIPVKSLPDTFRLDLPAMEAAVNEKTRVVLINSPNNPTGVVYRKDELSALADILRKKSAQYGRPIYMLADEPYRFLTYDGVTVPPFLPLYDYTLICSSFSKNLALAGERIGYVVVNPAMPGKAELMDGLILAHRILGYINAPAIGQRILQKALGAQVDASIYAARRALMAEMLTKAGYEFSLPQGAFYFFPKSPEADDIAFVGKLLEEKILVVPGTGFGYPGYFRMAFCVDEAVIRRAAEGFARARAKV